MVKAFFEIKGPTFEFCSYDQAIWFVATYQTLYSNSFHICKLGLVTPPPELFWGFKQNSTFDRVFNKWKFLKKCLIHFTYIIYIEQKSSMNWPLNEFWCMHIKMQNIPITPEMSLWYLSQGISHQGKHWFDIYHYWLVMTILQFHISLKYFWCLPSFTHYTIFEMHPYYYLYQNVLLHCWLVFHFISRSENFSSIFLSWASELFSVLSIYK